jgi:hypothetical protein
LELVKAVSGLSVETWLDGIVLAVKPEICEKALLDNTRRKRFRQLVQKHPLDLFAGETLPWNYVRQTLSGAGTVQIDQQTQTVSARAEWKTFRDAMGKLPAGFVPLVAEALKNITENTGGLTQNGVDVADVKRTIRQSLTEVAM